MYPNNNDQWGNAFEQPPMAGAAAAPPPPPQYAPAPGKGQKSLALEVFTS